MNVGEKKNIRIAYDFPVFGAFVFSGFRIDCKVQRKRTVDDAAGDFSFLSHLGELSSVYGNGHFRIDNFHCRKRRNLRVWNAASVAYLNGILHNMYFFLQRRIGHERNVR